MIIHYAKIEKWSNPEVVRFIDYINREHMTTTPIEDMLQETKNFCQFKGLRCGKGGSHIWISDKNNERLAVIYYH